MTDSPTEKDTPIAAPPPLRRSTLERLFPEKRIFVKSDSGTRFVRIGPRQHVLAAAGLVVVMIWTVAATSFLVIDLVSGPGAREQARTEQQFYDERLNALAGERDAHRAATLELGARYDAALDAMAAFQDRLLASDLRIAELESGTDALQRILRETHAERAALEARLAAVTGGDGGPDLATLDRRRAEAERTAGFLVDALGRTAEERDGMADVAGEARARLDEMARELASKAETTDRIFEQLEEAVTLAMEPLGKMFEDVGLAPERILDQMRRRHSGQGGPLTPIALSTKGRSDLLPEEMRANDILTQMDALNLYRIAADKVPFALPLRGAARLTSGFGFRRDPFGGGRRMHEGIDWAGRYGMPIYASADGVVIHAGWQSGYGRLIKIQHEFGIETRFGHLAQLDVREGQRVSRGDRIGAMGNSGRSTGTHLHYEVRVGDQPVNPMIYIKAASNVF